MAIASVSAARGVAGNGTPAGNTLAVTPNATLSAGNIVVCLIACDNIVNNDGDNSDVLSITDTGNNVWTKLAELTNGGGAAAAGATASLWMSKLTTQLTTGSTITITFAASINERAAALAEFSVASGCTLGFTAAPVNNETNAANGFGSAAFSGLTSASRLYLRCGAKEANSTTGLTVSASFTEITGTRSRNNSAAEIVRGEFRINASTGETSNPTLAVTGDTAAVFVALEEVLIPNVNDGSLTPTESVGVMISVNVVESDDSPATESVTVAGAGVSPVTVSVSDDDVATEAITVQIGVTPSVFDTGKNAVAADPAFARTAEIADLGGVSSKAVTFAAATQIGDLVMIQFDWDDSTPRTITSVQDNAAGGSNSYTQVGSTLAGTLGGTNFKSAVFWAIAKATETLTITVTLSGTTPVIELRAIEFSNPHPTSPIDNFNSSAPTATANPSINLSTVADRCQIWGVDVLNTGSAGAGAGYTERGTLDGAESETRTAVKTPAGSETVPFTSGSADHLIWAISIAPAPGDELVAIQFGTATTGVSVNVNDADSATESVTAQIPMSVKADDRNRATPAFASDDFNRANGTVGSNWSQVRPASGTVEIVSSKIQGVTGNCGIRWAGLAAAADHYSSIEIGGLGANDFTKAIAAWSRVSADIDATRDYYFAQVRDDSASTPGTRTTEFGKVVDGVTTFFLQTTATWDNGDRLEIESNGSIHRYYRISAGVRTLIYEQSDGDLTTGQPGVGFLIATGPTGDNWEGGDLIAVAESTTQKISVAPSVSDSDAATESVTVQIPMSVVVSDADAQAEFVDVQRNPLLVSVSDDDVASESLTVQIPMQVVAADTDAASESVLVTVNPLVPSVFDDDVATEVVAVTVNPLVPSVFDDSTSTDAATVQIPMQVVVSDDDVASEFVAVSISSGGSVSVNVSDDDVAAEAVTVQIPMAVVVADDTPATEAVTVQIPMQVVVADADGATETATVQIPMQVVAADDTPATENVVVQIPMAVVVSDDTSATEAIAVYISPLLVSVADDTPGTEAVTVQIPMAVVVTDDEPTTESVAVTVNPLVPVVFDDAPSSEFVLVVVQPIVVAVSDDVSSTDSATVQIPMQVVVSEDDAATEAVALAQQPLLVDVHDDESVVESVLVISTAAVVIQVADQAGATEAVTAAIPMAVVVADDETEAEQVTVAVTPLFVAVFDDEVASEAVDARISLQVIVSDDAPATESVLVVVNPLVVSVEDTESPTEAVALELNPLTVVVFDDNVQTESVLVSTNQAVVVQVTDDDSPADVVAAAIPMAVVVFDDEIAADAADVATPLLVLVTDADSPSDAVDVLGNVVVVVFDSRSITEAVALARNPLLADVSDTDAAADVPQISLGAEGALILSVFDAEGVSERRSVLSHGYEEALFKNGRVLTARTTGEVVRQGTTAGEVTA